MFNVCRVERQIGEQVLSIETGKIARQADGAVLVQYGETVVMVAVVTSKPRADLDYFPLSVDYREKQSAAGKFPGGFIKREGRPSTKEILTARMIDRPIRPMFPEGYCQEVQIMASVLSFDGEHDPDVLAMIGASAALHISKIPFMGPTGSCRVARVNGEFVAFPTNEQLKDSDLNLLLGGNKDSMNMIEVSSQEAQEQAVVDAVAEAHKVVVEVCDMAEEMRSKCGIEKEIPLAERDEQFEKDLKAQIFDKLLEVKQTADKDKRSEGTGLIRDEVIEQYCECEDETQAKDKGLVKRAFAKIEEMAVRELLLQGKRSDNRKFDEVREISCEVGILPRNHGSALFTRGQTQALVSVTLGTIRDAQIIDGLQEEYSQTFTLHYNFPPYSVGEVRFIRGPGRREIGHGALAEKALENIKPDESDFAYTIRIISDITESNGSSSMASVCGGCLALMDAGVPIKRPVAGISVGMISDDQGKYELITDIVGEEDHFGDMDFKVAGSSEGITAIQLDIKLNGISHEVIAGALERAKKARLEILDIMQTAIDTPRGELSEYAPKLISVEINPEFIGKIIGPGGKNIKALQEQTDTTIEIDDSGIVYISCVGGNGHLEAKSVIEAMTTPPTVGKIYANSKIVGSKDFGVFVEIAPGVEGLCHISELSDGYVKEVGQVCKLGDKIDVKLILIDDQGRLKLSRKQALAELGKTDKTDDGTSDKK